MTELVTAIARKNDAPYESVLGLVDPAAVSELARAESRNREVHLPPISAFRWWARRTQAVNGAILDAFGELFGPRRLVVDPFAGGGTIGLAAIVRRHRMYVQDIDPWAACGLQTMLALPDADDIREAGRLLGEAAEPTLRRAYATRCSDGSPGQLVHTYRVAVGRCSSCGCDARLFPYAVLTLLVRKERKQPEAYMACGNGHVFLGRADSTCACTECGISVDPTASYTPRRTITCTCGHSERLQVKAQSHGLSWEVVLVERVSEDGTREFGLPSRKELLQAAERKWDEPRDLGVIPGGRETSVLLRHGFERWNDLYPRRQQAVTQTLLDLADRLPVSVSVRDVLRLSIVGSVEFAGHLSRWDRWYLKSNDATAGHRFNFSTFVPEPNVWGAGSIGRGTVQRRLRSFTRAADWLREHTNDDLSAHFSSDPEAQADTGTDVMVVHGNSERIALRDESADLVLTDPPYHDDVQYSELSLLFRTWAGLSLDSLAGEAAVNLSTGLNAGVDAYRELLTRIFRECRRVMKTDGRLIFSYANREPAAWVALFSALHEAGFTSIGYMVVHSENETDYAKRDVRACTRDLVMELVPQTDRRIARWAPPKESGDPEDDFLRRVTEGFFDVGRVGARWDDGFVSSLRQSPFVASLTGKGAQWSERNGKGGS